jgi:hypothetical protein
VSYAAPPGCAPQAIGGPWLALSCTQSAATTVWLYDISSGRYQSIPAAADPARCGVGGCGSILAVGDDWLAFEKQSTDPDHNSLQVIMLNIARPSARPEVPSSGAWEFDLNNRSGTRRLCAPLHAPTISLAYGTALGYLAFDGRAAIAAGGGGAYLERCGTQRHRFLTFTLSGLAFYGCPAVRCPPAADSRAILWQTAAGRLGGLFLPNQQRFAINLPRAIDRSTGYANGDEYRLVLTHERLYLATRQGQVWTAPAPALPKRLRGQPNRESRPTSRRE